jgi:putative methyltransferase (TIGR04325 family)
MQCASCDRIVEQMQEISHFRRLRFKQIRVTASLFGKLSTRPIVGKLVEILGRNDFSSRALVGFRRIFPTFAAARAYASRYGVPSHEHPGNTVMHSEFNQRARSSDYPVLFYMQRYLGEIKSVLDIGGSAGNLFYCYDEYLKFRPDLRWTVNEGAANTRAGQRLAQERGEPRLHFIDNRADCSRADTVLISGSLHYFEELPPDLMRHLDPKPRHVFINRTPVIDGPTVITIQDAGAYYAISPARLLRRSTLIQAMEAANYDLVDEWTIDDLRFRIPLDPKRSAGFYSGFYFKLKER